METYKANSFIKTNGLTLGYSRDESKILFKSVDLNLEGGQLVCFMGPNGIGKSTLIRTLAGLQKPLAGEIYFPAKEPELKIEKWISLVLTDKIIASNMTVYDLVSFGRYPYLLWNLKLTVEDKKVINDAIESTRIESLANKKVDELSDGQMQLALIARALAQDTPVILLDEPTAHLDLNNRVEIMRLLRNTARTLNKAVLVATHELDLALQTADVLWLASEHKSIEVGIPEDLVLNGTLDEIFKLKGFDLKTGKVNHEPYRNIEINLKGTGYEFLWTKNALDREGYSMGNKSHINVEIVHNEKKISWLINSHNNSKQVFSIEDLLGRLK
jgi:iron complex transport system ATP-binding protein